MGLLSAIIGPVTDLVSEFVEDKDKSNQLTAALNMRLSELMQAELEAQKQIVLAEAKGGILQRNWRPALMVWFAGLIGGYWFGFTPENLSEASINDLFDLVKLGVGGYVVGRSAEKIAQTVAPSLGKSK